MAAALLTVNVMLLMGGFVHKPNIIRHMEMCGDPAAITSSTGSSGLSGHSLTLISYSFKGEPATTSAPETTETQVSTPTTSSTGKTESTTTMSTTARDTTTEYLENETTTAANATVSSNATDVTLSTRSNSQGTTTSATKRRKKRSLESGEGVRGRRSPLNLPRDTRTKMAGCECYVKSTSNVTVHFVSVTSESGSQKIGAKFTLKSDHNGSTIPIQLQVVKERLDYTKSTGFKQNMILSIANEEKTPYNLLLAIEGGADTIVVCQSREGGNTTFTGNRVSATENPERDGTTDNDGPSAVSTTLLVVGIVLAIAGIVGLVFGAIICTRHGQRDAKQKKNTEPDEAMVMAKLPVDCTPDTDMDMQDTYEVVTETGDGRFVPQRVVLPDPSSIASAGSVDNPDGVSSPLINASPTKQTPSPSKTHGVFKFFGKKNSGKKGNKKERKSSNKSTKMSEDKTEEERQIGEDGEYSSAQCDDIYEVVDSPPPASKADIKMATPFLLALKSGSTMPTLKHVEKAGEKPELPPNRRESDQNKLDSQPSQDKEEEYTRLARDGRNTSLDISKCATYEGVDFLMQEGGKSAGPETAGVVGKGNRKFDVETMANDDDEKEEEEYTHLDRTGRQLSIDTDMLETYGGVEFLKVQRKASGDLELSEKPKQDELAKKGNDEEEEGYTHFDRTGRQGSIDTDKLETYYGGVEFLKVQRKVSGDLELSDKSAQDEMANVGDANKTKPEDSKDKNEKDKRDSDHDYEEIEFDQFSGRPTIGQHAVDPYCEGWESDVSDEKVLMAARSLSASSFLGEAGPGEENGVGEKGKEKETKVGKDNGTPTANHRYSDVVVVGEGDKLTMVGGDNVDKCAREDIGKGSNQASGDDNTQDSTEHDPHEAKETDQNLQQQRSKDDRIDSDATDQSNDSSEQKTKENLADLNASTSKQNCDGTNDVNSADITSATTPTMPKKSNYENARLSQFQRKELQEAAENQKPANNKTKNNNYENARLSQFRSKEDKDEKIEDHQSTVEGATNAANELTSSSSSTTPTTTPTSAAPPPPTTTAQTTETGHSLSQEKPVSQVSAENNEDDSGADLSTEFEPTACANDLGQNILTTSL